MTTATVTPRERVLQQEQALASANRIRLARAALKRAIRRDEVSVAEVLLSDMPDWLKRMTASELVRTQYRVGRRRCLQFLAQVPCSEQQPIGWLTMRQRTVLAELTEGARERSIVVGVAPEEVAA